MKKTTKKSPSKASHKKAIKDLEIKPGKGGSVSGGCGAGMSKSLQSDGGGASSSSLFKHDT
jgi:hypothetical protein